MSLKNVIAYLAGLCGYRILSLQTFEGLLYDTNQRNKYIEIEKHKTQGRAKTLGSLSASLVKNKDNKPQAGNLLANADKAVNLPQEELNGEHSLSANFYFERGMAKRQEGDEDLAFAYFARAVSLIPRYELARDELKKMSEECLALAQANYSSPDRLRLLVRAVEMDIFNAKARSKLESELRKIPGSDLTKMCFIFYDAHRAKTIHGEAYKRALEFVTIGGIVGDVLEFGVLGGWSSRLFCETMRDLFNLNNIHLFDSFEGLPEYESQIDAASYEIKGRNIWHDKMRFPDDFLARFGGRHELHIRERLAEIIRPERIFIHKGFYSETLKKDFPLKAAIVHIDCDLYQSTCEVLWGLHRMKALQDGTVLLFDDWNCNRASPNYGERKAFREFLEGQKQFTASSWYSYGYNGMAFIMHENSVETD